MVAHRGPADRDDQIGTFGQFKDSGQFFSAVPRDGQKASMAAFSFDQRLQGKAVRGDDLVGAGRFARHHQPAQYDPAGLTEEEIAQGGELFRTNCSACHNFAGNGGALPNGKYAPSLVGVGGKEIYEALRTGPQQMPVFSKGALTDTEARQIIGYLNELHEQPAGGFTLGGIGPVSEGFWTWVLGIGGLAGFAMWIASRGARAR